MSLFFFHEALHISKHNLNSDNYRGMGRYPKIMEEVDYQSDVYAMLHQYNCNIPKPEQCTTFFSQLIHAATETMWAFDELEDPREMEVRRINRYLIWYFIAVQIEDANCESFREVLAILAVKPVIELRLTAVTSPDRSSIKIDLENIRTEELAIGVFYENRPRTFGFQGEQLSLDTMVSGFRERDPEKIKYVMRQLISKLILR